MKWNKKEVPYLGQEKVVKKFAIMPTKVNVNDSSKNSYQTMWIWLENYYVVYKWTLSPSLSLYWCEITRYYK